MAWRFGRYASEASVGMGRDMEVCRGGRERGTLVLFTRSLGSNPGGGPERTGDGGRPAGGTRPLSQGLDLPPQAPIGRCGAASFELLSAYAPAAAEEYTAGSVVDDEIDPGRIFFASGPALCVNRSLDDLGNFSYGNFPFQVLGLGRILQHLGAVGTGHGQDGSAGLRGLADPRPSRAFRAAPQ